MGHERRFEDVAAADDGRPAFVHRQIPLVVAIEALLESGQQIARNAHDADGLRAVDPFLRTALHQQVRPPVRVDDDALGQLRSAVQTVGRRRTDFDPLEDTAIRRAQPQRRFVGFGQPLAEREPFLVLEGKRENARQQVRTVLGRVPRHPEVEVGVDATIDVRERDLEAMEHAVVVATRATIAAPIATCSSVDGHRRRILRPPRMTRIRIAALCLSLLPAILPCQTAATAPAPHLLIDTVGPDGWRVRLGPTNLGSLLESEQGRKLWEPHLLPMLGMWQKVFGDEAAFGAARDVVLGYGGRIKIGVWLDLEGEVELEPLSLAFVFEGDGRTDLAALATEVRRLQDRLTGEWGEVTIDGAKVAIRTNRDEAMTAPIPEGNVLLVAMAKNDGLPAAVAQARALAAGAAGKPPAPNTPALRLLFDTHTIVARAAAADQEPFAGELGKALGFPSLGATAMTITTAGPRVQYELTQAFVDDARGVFAALFPATEGIPALQRLRPAKGSWKVGRFDLRSLYEVVERAMQTQESDGESIREEARKELGVDPVDGLLAHTTDETMLYVLPPEDPERLAQTEWAFVVGLRDQAAFQKGLDTALDKARPMLSREATIEHPAGEVRRYGNMFGYDVWLAVGQNLFAVAGGSNAEDRLTALLDGAKTPPPESATTTPADFETLRRHLPPGCNGLGFGAIDSMVGLPIGWWTLFGRGMAPFVFTDFSDTPEDAADNEEERERVLALMREHHLGTLQTATGYAGRQWCWRLFW